MASNKSERNPIVPIPLRDLFAIIDHLAKSTPGPDQASRQNLADLIRFHFFTASRPCEAIAARLCDFKPNGEFLIYRPKIGEQKHPDRTIYAGEPIRELVESYRGKRKAKAFLFSQDGDTGKGAIPYTVRTYLRAFQRTCGELGLPKYTLQQIRHTVTTWLRAKHGIEPTWFLLGYDKKKKTVSDAQQLDEASIMEILANWNREVETEVRQGSN